MLVGQGFIGYLDRGAGPAAGHGKRDELFSFVCRDVIVVCRVRAALVAMDSAKSCSLTGIERQYRWVAMVASDNA
jgi:hypothetical protein